MIIELEKVGSEGNLHIPHFRAEANLLFALEELFRCYGDNETGQHRHYFILKVPSTRLVLPDLILISPH